MVAWWESHKMDRLFVYLHNQVTTLSLHCPWLNPRAMCLIYSLKSSWKWMEHRPPGRPFSKDQTGRWTPLPCWLGVYRSAGVWPVFAPHDLYWLFIWCVSARIVVSPFYVLPCVHWYEESVNMPSWTWKIDYKHSKLQLLEKRNLAGNERSHSAARVRCPGTSRTWLPNTFLMTHDWGFRGHEATGQFPTWRKSTDAPSAAKWPMKSNSLMSMATILGLIHIIRIVRISWEGGGPKPFDMHNAHILRRGWTVLRPFDTSQTTQRHVDP